MHDIHEMYSIAVWPNLVINLAQTTLRYHVTIKKLFLVPEWYSGDHRRIDCLTAIWQALLTCIWFDNFKNNFHEALCLPRIAIS